MHRQPETANPSGARPTQQGHSSKAAARNVVTWKCSWEFVRGTSPQHPPISNCRAHEQCFTALVRKRTDAQRSTGPRKIPDPAVWKNYINTGTKASASDFRTQWVHNTGSMHVYRYSADHPTVHALRPTTRGVAHARLTAETHSSMRKFFAWRQTLVPIFT